MNGYFLGGYGTVLSQLFGRNFPNYSAGISLNIPIRNRAAQADYITDQLNFRQQLIQDKQLHNNIRQNVINARVALAQARAAYDTSVEARKLQEQTSAGTRRKYELGTATILDVVITQRDTTDAAVGRSAGAQHVHPRADQYGERARARAGGVRRQYRRGQNGVGRASRRPDSGGAAGRGREVVTARRILPTHRTCIAWRPTRRSIRTNPK